MKKTIAIFSGFYLPFLGGVERYTYNIVQKLVEKDYRVIIVTSQFNEELQSKEQEGAVTIYRLPIKKFGRSRYPFLDKNQKYQALLKEIENEQIDYYVTNTRFQLPSILGTELAKKAGKKALVIEHGTTYLTVNNPIADQILHQIERHLIKRVKKNTDVFYGVSQEAASWLTEFGIQARGVLYNAVEASDFEQYHTSKDTDKIVITYSGRLQAKFKGVEMLLATFVELSKEFDNIELVIAGDGPIYAEMTERYQQENITFLGKVSHEEVMKLNNKSDIFVLMSKIEGFSTSMLEAALMQNVIVTTDVGGARELIPDESYGYVIENDEKVLVKTLRQIILDQQKMKAMQARVSQRVLDHFTWDKTAEAFEKAFQEL